MKKLILIFGVFAIICVIISFVAEQSVLSLEREFMPSESVSESDEVYNIKSENGRIVVYRGDELLMRTDTAVNTLPKRDQKQLLYGIVAYSKQEMERVLQDYCS